MLPWSIKYLPKNLENIKGQKNLTLLFDLIKNYKKKPIILYGPTGVGKTSTIYAIANELNYDVIEFNSSGLRNKATLIQALENSTQQMSLISKGKIILIDEIEGLSIKDRGALSAVFSYIPKCKWPIVLVCDDPYESKLKKIRKNSFLIEFNKVDKKDIFDLLKNICIEESLEYDEEILNNIARRCGGDARAAINDLQSAVINEKIEPVDFSFRNNEEKIKDSLRLMFKCRDLNVLKNVFDNVDIDVRELRSWIAENLPREYKGQDLVDGFDMLSKSDIFFGRIMKWQYWRYLVYVYAFMGPGVGMAKKNKSDYCNDYKQSSLGLKIWIYKRKNAKKISISEKLASYTHTSNNLAYKSAMPYFKIFANRYQESIDLLNLEQDEIEWILK